MPVLRTLVTLLPSVQLWEVGVNPCCDEELGGGLEPMGALGREIAPRKLEWRMLAE